MSQEICVVEEIFRDRKCSGQIILKRQCMKLRRRLRKILENFLQTQFWFKDYVYFTDTVHLVKAWSDCLNSFGIQGVEDKIGSDGQFSHFWPYQHFLCPARVAKRYLSPEFRRTESWWSPMLWYLTEVNPRPCAPSWVIEIVFLNVRKYVAQDFNKEGEIWETTRFCEILGLGLPLPYPRWELMISESKIVIINESWSKTLGPGLSIRCCCLWWEKICYTRF